MRSQFDFDEVAIAIFGVEIEIAVCFFEIAIVMFLGLRLRSQFDFCEVAIAILGVEVAIAV